MEEKNAEAELAAEAKLAAKVLAVQQLAELKPAVGMPAEEKHTEGCCLQR